MAPMALTPADPDRLGASIAAPLVARSVSPSTSSSPSNVLLSAARGLTTLMRRQSKNVFVPANYPGANSSPLPGNVVGIVLGSVAAFLLLMWLLYTCFNMGGTPPRSSVDELGVESLQRSTRTRSDRGSRRRSRSREVIEVRSPPRPRRERERVRETTIVREESTRRAPPPEDEDIVEVIEEHSPPPRRHSRRVSSGYRNVDPDEFAGGDSPMRSVRR